MTCEACGTNCGSLNPNMPPEGSGDILIVLDEVTSEQDFQGSYYSGALGRLLEQVLSRAGLRAEDCTIGCAAACLGDAPSTFQLLGNYRTVVACGDNALKLLCRKSGIQDKRGKSFKLHRDFGIDADVWPTYGFGLVRRVPNYRNIVVADIQRAISQGRESEKIEWEWWDGQELPDSDVYSYDIETIDEKGEYTETATQCAVAGEGFCYVSRPNVHSARELGKNLRDKLYRSGTVVGHNSWQFDVPCTRIGGISNFPLGEDTMVLAYLEDETQPKGLESLCVKHLGIKGWKDEFEHPLGSEGFALYNARDVVYTLRLYRRLREILGERYSLVDNILRPAFVALSRMSERGVYIDPTAVARERNSAETLLSTSLARIRELTSAKFNPGSSKQVGEYLETQGIWLPKTATGKPDTSVKVLKEIINGH